MRLKVVAGVLMLFLAVSLGFNVYHYLQVTNRQNIINNIRSEIVLEWANEMDIAAHYLKNVTTNVDVAEQYGVRWFFLSAYHIMKIAYEQGDDGEFYEPLAYAPLDVAGNLIAYEENAQAVTVIERRISSGAIEMFGNLSEKIWNVTDLIFKEAQTLASQNGVDPMQLLEEKGILDDVVEGCLDISYYSLQIAEFNPKFQ